MNELHIFNPEKYNRQSNRLAGYDYSTPGHYFVTICTENRECLFGAVQNGIMGLSILGIVVQNEWLKTPELRSNVLLDEFVVMPNHIHGIVEIIEQTKTNVDSRRGVLQYAPTIADSCINIDIGFRSPSNNLGAIIRGFKGATTKLINQNIDNLEHGSTWQRNFYDHIIETDEELEIIRHYIQNNPKNWDNDRNNPKNI